MKSIIIKVAAYGLDEKSLGLDLASVQPRLVELEEKFGNNVCGEGGEFESLTLESSAYEKGFIVIEESEVVVVEKNQVQVVAYLKIKKARLESKN